MNFLENVGNDGLQSFVENMEAYIGYFALTIAYIIEVVGVVAIVIGLVKSFYKYFKYRSNTEHSIIIDLGQALAMGLTVIMGAEILKSIVVKTPQELIVLGVIIVLRAILAVLIHWELTNEKKEIVLKKEQEQDKEDTKNEE